MSQHNAKNERVKRDYFSYLREARRRSEKSIDTIGVALDRFERGTDWKDFAKFHRAQAVAFKRRLAEERNPSTKALLSKATLNNTLRSLREFFLWLAREPGFKTKLHFSDADYFNMSDKDLEIARAKRIKRVPTLDQMHHIVATMPANSPIERRNRALVAFAMLTGARDGALASLQLKHVDLAEGMVDQDAREVNTKFSKTIRTWFFPVGGDSLTIVTDWIVFLRSELKWATETRYSPQLWLAKARMATLPLSGWIDVSGPMRRPYAKFSAKPAPQPVWSISTLTACAICSHCLEKESVAGQRNSRPGPRI